MLSILLDELLFLFVASVMQMVSPSTTDVPAKSSNSKDRGLMKKLKGFDGLSVSIGNVNAEITVGDGRGKSRRFVHLENLEWRSSSSSFTDVVRVASLHFFYQDNF